MLTWIFHELICVINPAIKQSMTDDVVPTMQDIEFSGRGIYCPSLLNFSNK